MVLICMVLYGMPEHLDAITTISRDIPGTLLTYFNDGRVRVIFLGLKFWPKVIFLGL